MSSSTLLPWDQDRTHPDAGWKVQTTVKKSAIPGAGSGRYVQEHVAKGTVVREAVLVDASPCELRPGTVVICRNVQEVLSTFHVDQADDGTPGKNQDQKRILEQIANFFFAPENLRTASAMFDQAAFCWVPVCYINHQTDSRANVIQEIRQSSRDRDRVVIVALRDIAAGEELCGDYRQLPLPSWFKEFCSRKDLQSLGYELNP